MVLDGMNGKMYIECLLLLLLSRFSRVINLGPKEFQGILTQFVNIVYQ